MGWSVTLKTDHNVTEADMDKIVSELPQWMQQRFGRAKQAWGYSLAADVHIGSANEVICSGSCSISGNIAEGFCESLARRLEHIGYTVKVGKMYV